MATPSDPDTTPPVDSARDELQNAVPEAAEKLTDLLDAEDERIQIRAAEAILDRAGVVKAKRVTSRSAEQDVGGAAETSLYDDPY